MTYALDCSSSSELHGFTAVKFTAVKNFFLKKWCSGAALDICFLMLYEALPDYLYTFKTAFCTNFCLYTPVCMLHLESPFKMR